jgi:hypothetical protein
MAIIIMNFLQHGHAKSGQGEELKEQKKKRLSQNFDALKKKHKRKQKKIK